MKQIPVVLALALAFAGCSREAPKEPPVVHKACAAVKAAVRGIYRLESAVAGDETLATFDAADGAVAFRYRTRTAGNSLTFAYAPGDGDTGGALLAQASGGPGLVFVIR